MKIDPMVDMAINTKLKLVQEQVNMRVVKLALDMMKQDGHNVSRLLGDMDSPDQSRGHFVDISV